MGAFRSGSQLDIPGLLGFGWDGKLISNYSEIINYNSTEFEQWNFRNPLTWRMLTNYLQKWWFFIWWLIRLHGARVFAGKVQHRLRNSHSTVLFIRISRYSVILLDAIFQQRKRCRHSLLKRRWKHQIEFNCHKAALHTGGIHWYTSWLFRNHLMTNPVSSSLMSKSQSKSNSGADKFGLSRFTL